MECFKTKSDHIGIEIANGYTGSSANIKTKSDHIGIEIELEGKIGDALVGN